jgi:hypothetical protein
VWRVADHDLLPGLPRASDAHLRILERLGRTPGEASLEGKLPNFLWRRDYLDRGKVVLQTEQHRLSQGLVQHGDGSFLAAPVAHDVEIEGMSDPCLRIIRRRIENHPHGNLNQDSQLFHGAPSAII